MMTANPMILAASVGRRVPWRHTNSPPIMTQKITFVGLSTNAMADKLSEQARDPNCSCCRTTLSFMVRAAEANGQ